MSASQYVINVPSVNFGAASAVPNSRAKFTSSGDVEQFLSPDQSLNHERCS